MHTIAGAIHKRDHDLLDMVLSNVRPGDAAADNVFEGWCHSAPNTPPKMLSSSYRSLKDNKTEFS